MQRKGTVVGVVICVLLGCVLATQKCAREPYPGQPSVVDVGAPVARLSSSSDASPDSRVSTGTVQPNMRSRAGADPAEGGPDHAPLSELPRLRVTATPAHTTIVRVMGAPSGAMEPVLLNSVEGEESLYTLPEPGSWTLVAVDVGGTTSALVTLVCEAAGTCTADFDFQRPVVIRGMVFDGVFGPRLPGAEVARIEAPIVASLEASQAGVDRAAADPEGNFEVRVPAGTSWTLRIQHPGYRTCDVAVTGELGDLTVDGGDIALEPVDALQVELMGLAGVDPTGYRIREGWEAEPTVFDSEARATLMVPRAMPDLSLNLFAPDGVNLRIDLPGLPLDHNPLTIDLGGRREVEVEVLEWTAAAFAERNIHLCVTSTDERGIVRFSAAKVAGARTRAHAWGRHEVVAAVYEVSEDVDTTLALASFALADVGLTRTSVNLGRRPAWKLVDEAGQGAADSVVIARFAEHPRAYSMVLYADPRGIVDAPIGLTDALVANIVLSDGSFRCDLVLPHPSADGAPIEVGLGHIESYEILLECGSAPLAWHRVSVCSEAPLDLGLLLMSDDRGHIGPLAIRSGGQPRLVVHDPRLVELGRSFVLEPGTNRVSLARRTGAGQR